jgi:hypothetical protein
VVTGESGTVGGYAFAAPSVEPGGTPDALRDARLGTDVRLLGRPGGRFRLGLSAQLFVPNGNRADYVSDGTFRGVIRALVAGDLRAFTWAAQLGVHIRPLDDSPTPGSPKGSELDFGLAAGLKLPLGRAARWAAVVGPELWGASAFSAFFAENGTALEALFAGRVEGTRVGHARLRVKLGVGAGLNHHFGAAEWRLVAGVELFGEHQPR